MYLKAQYVICLKKGSQNNVDNSKIFSVCIDDFALKKRQRYGTVMINAETLKIVDMIESRETVDVSKWLAEFPNIRVVSRDGSQQYAAAITEAHPGAMQVSDRFHIIKNLCDRANDVFQKLFTGRLAVPVTTGTQDIADEYSQSSTTTKNFHIDYKGWALPGWGYCYSVQPVK